MPPAGRFWPNVTVLAAAHVAIIITVVFWERDIKRPNFESIVWLNTGPDIAVRRVPEAHVSIETPSLHSKPQDEEES